MAGDKNEHEMEQNTFMEDGDQLEPIFSKAEQPEPEVNILESRPSLYSPDQTKLSTYCPGTFH